MFRGKVTHSHRVQREILTRQLGGVTERFGVKLVPTTSYEDAPQRIWIASLTAEEALSMDERTEAAFRSDVWPGFRGAVSGYLFCTVGVDAERNRRLQTSMKVHAGFELLPPDEVNNSVNVFAYLGVDGLPVA